MKVSHVVVLSAALASLALPAHAKRYEHPDAVPFMQMREALTIAEEVLQNQGKADLRCKGASNLITNGGECWVFQFVSDRKDTYAIEVYAGRRVRHGIILPYPFSPEREIEQLGPPSKHVDAGR